MPERMHLAVLGQGCECVNQHVPATYVPAKHHIVPESWGGPTIKTNLVLICPNTHTATHRLIDSYVRTGGDPGWEVRRHFSPYIRDLAARAWAGRPERPTITSLPGRV